MKSKLKSLALLAIAVVFAFTAVGCRTAHGFGEDMEKAGEKIQDKTE